MRNEVIVAEYNPKDLLHELLQTPENLAIAQSLLNKPKENQKPSERFSKEFIQSMPHHEWIKGVECELYQGMLLHLYQQIQKESKNNFVAIDLETTSLNNAIKKHNASTIIYNDIVAVCIATSANKGYYIPIKHNGLDGVKNYDKGEVIAFLAQIIKEFKCIYHNAQFDLAVLSNNGLDLAELKFIDTMLLSKLIGLKDLHNSLRLKILASRVLKRDMVQFGDLIYNDNITIDLLPASSAYVYGVCDAINTYALYEVIVKSDNNPLIYQRQACEILHKAVLPTISLLRYGMPIDYDKTLESTNTILRRMIMLENLFVFKSQQKDFSITQNEKIGLFIHDLIKRDYEVFYNVDLTNPADFNIFHKEIVDRYQIEVKLHKLAQGKKVSISVAQSVLESIKSNVDSAEYLQTQTKDLLKDLSTIILNFRELDNRIKIYTAFLKNCFNDDLNQCRIPISLKLAGADTYRFTNKSDSKGAFDKLDLSKKNPQILKGSGVSTFNAQGISSDLGKYTNLKKISNIHTFNDKISQVDKRLNTEVKARLMELLS